ncbi:MAG TPA: cytochrome P450 [Tepidisphaeraceae bacterium]|nr:cytochrome P450 [Tepidisphaeraceae bacterium]
MTVPAKPAVKFAGPRGHPFAGCLPQMRSDPLGFYTRTRQEFGDYVRVRVVPHYFCYVFTHPDAVEHILHKQHKNYSKPAIFYKNVGLLVGEGLFTSEGETWLRQRRLVQPAFHTQYLALLAPVMIASAEKFVAEYRSLTGRPIDILPAMMQVGLRISSGTLFSADISGEADAVGAALRTAFDHVSNRLNSMQLVPAWFPTAANRRFARQKAFLDRIVANLISQRRKSAEKPRDLLTMLISARDEETGQAMSDRRIMDEVLTLLIGGHENVGAALAWTWYLLGLHPEIQEQAHDEIHGRLQGRSPTAEDIPHLPLLTAIFQESLRIYPPGWGELRQSIGPDEINGYPIPAKSLIVLCQWVTHRHPDFWDEPEKFDPKRFLAPTLKHRFAYFPFGGGPRICIGMQFSLLEGPLVLATILQHFRVQLVADQPIVPDPTFTLRPRDGLKVILHARK